MCGRFTSSTDPETLRERFRVEIPEGYRERYNLAPTQRALESCAIVTTRPNELVAAVHDRMPVILPPELEEEWLDAAISREHALALLEPYEAAAMSVRPVSVRVNSVRNDDAGLLVPDELAAA